MTNAIFATLDDDGRPTAFYSEDIHGARLEGGTVNPKCLIPPEAIEITADQWQECLANQGVRRFLDGKLIPCEPPPPLPDVSSKIDAFHLALGRFISDFAKVEGLIFLVFSSELSLPFEQTQILFPDHLGIRSIVEKLIAVRKAANALPSPALDRALPQFEEIRIQRNSLLHTEPRFNELGTPSIRNFRKANSLSKTVTVERLTAMSADLRTIQACIATHMLRGVAPQQFLDSGFGPASRVPWQYKST